MDYNGNGKKDDLFMNSVESFEVKRNIVCCESRETFEHYFSTLLCFFLLDENAHFDETETKDKGQEVKYHAYSVPQCLHLRGLVNPTMEPATKTKTILRATL